MSAPTRAEVLAAHVFPGDITVALTEAWIDCPCGERLSLPVVNLAVQQAEVIRAWAEHVDAALAAQEGEYGHRSNCQRFPTGYLCVADCPTVWQPQEGERGGAECPPDCERDHAPCSRNRWLDAKAALVNADAWDAGWCAGVSRFTQQHLEPSENPYRAALADPAGSLAKVKAEVLRAAADDMHDATWIDREGVHMSARHWLRIRADRIAGDQ